MTTAAQARARADSAVAFAASGPLREVYGQVDYVANAGGGSTVIAFAPFTFPPGGSTDPAAAPFLNQLATDGFTLTAEVLGDGTTCLRVTW
jgi:hypothetical protein